MANKKILVTGATGGIGEASVRQYVEYNDEVVVPTRRLEDTEAKYAGLPVKIQLCKDLADIRCVDPFIRDLAQSPYIPDIVDLTAGAFKWDNDKRVAMYPSVAQIADMLMKANYWTKKTVIDSVIKYYNGKTDHMVIKLTGSQAANFAADDERRVNLFTGYKQEGYIASMKSVQKYYLELLDLERRGIFRKIILDEPGLIDTPMAREEFTEETIGRKIDWSKEVSPGNYVRALHAKYSNYGFAA